jgi:hypothetical protein
MIPKLAPNIEKYLRRPRKHGRFTFKKRGGGGHPKCPGQREEIESTMHSNRS